MEPTNLLNKKAPTFKLPSNKGEIALKDFLGKKVVLYFYPKDNTPGCTLEARDFSKNLKEFEKKNAVVIGVSKDSVKKHCSFEKLHSLSIILASDENHEVQEKYGVWQKKKFMGREYMGTARTTFLIDEKGKIVKIWEEVNVKLFGHAKEVLEEIKSLK